MKSVSVLTLSIAVGASLCCAIAAPGTAAAQPPAAKPASCASAGDLSFVCGLTNVEDLVPVEGGRWLVGTSFKAGSAGLYLIDTAAKAAQPVALSIAAKPDPLYGNCAPPDLHGLQTHGVDAAAGPKGITTVLAVNHGGRESVEVFHLNPAKAAAEWVGCVVMPKGADGNSVAFMRGGAFAVTKFLDTEDKQGLQHVLSGVVNGVTYIWTPAKGFTQVPGTQLSGDNGLLVSPDGQWLFINAYGTHEVYRVSVSGKEPRTQAKVDFSPDNLRWAPDGTIFVTGQYVSAQTLNARHGWATVRLDPKTLAVTPVVKEAGLPEFDDATTAVQVGQTLWFGTFRGDRVAYRAAP